VILTTSLPPATEHDKQKTGAERSDHKAEPGAKRSGATGSTLNKTQRPCTSVVLFVAFNADPVAPLRFAPGSAYDYNARP